MKIYKLMFKGEEAYQADSLEKVLREAVFDGAFHYEMMEMLSEELGEEVEDLEGRLDEPEVQAAMRRVEKLFITTNDLLKDGDIIFDDGIGNTWTLAVEEN